MPHLPILGARWEKGEDLPHFVLQRPHPWGHNSMSNPYQSLMSPPSLPHHLGENVSNFFYYRNLTTKHSNMKQNLKKTNSDDK